MGIGLIYEQATGIRPYFFVIIYSNIINIFSELPLRRQVNHWFDEIMPERTHGFLYRWADKGFKMKAEALLKQDV